MWTVAAKNYCGEERINVKFLDCDSKHNIHSIQKTGVSGRYNINWETIGFEAFIIMYGEDRSSIALDSSLNESRLKEWLEVHCDELFDNEYLTDDSLGVKVYTEDFASFKQNGGFSVSGQPGAYAVYGIIKDSDGVSVYIPADNVFYLSVDIAVETAPVYVTKGFFSKKNVYAGYRRVTVNHGVNGLKRGTVYYTVGERGCKYPVPTEIINRGGSFFVKCDEASNITFGTTNKAGIRIR